MTYIEPEVTFYNVIKTSNSSFQSLTSSHYVIATGSNINYSPFAGSTKTVYEFTSVYTWSSDAQNINNIEIKLMSGSDINNLSDVGTGYVNSIGRNTSNTNQNLFSLKYELDSWSGQKTLALHVSGNIIDRKIYLNGSQTSAQTSTDIFFNPIVSCFSY